jgi:hypothetical protein
MQNESETYESYRESNASGLHVGRLLRLGTERLLSLLRVLRREEAVVGQLRSHASLLKGAREGQWLGPAKGD